MVRAVEQGLRFTVYETPHPITDADEYSRDEGRNWSTARRVYLGWAGGTDWLHNAIEADLGEDSVWYDVKSRRDATHIGASGEIADVGLILMGLAALDFARHVYIGFAERIGATGVDAIISTVRHRAQEHRREQGLEWTDGPPNFFNREVESLTAGFRGELADMINVPEAQLELTSAKREGELALEAQFVDRGTGEQFIVRVGEDWATFHRRRQVTPDPEDE